MDLSYLNIVPFAAMGFGAVSVIVLWLASRAFDRKYGTGPRTPAE